MDTQGTLAILAASALTGCFIGWAACRILGTEARLGLLANALIGIVGALLAAAALGPRANAAAVYEGSLAISSLVVALFGSVALVTLVRLLRSGRSH